MFQLFSELSSRVIYSKEKVSLLFRNLTFGSSRTEWRRHSEELLKHRTEIFSSRRVDRVPNKQHPEGGPSNPAELLKEHLDLSSCHDLERFPTEVAEEFNVQEILGADISKNKDEYELGHRESWLNLGSKLNKSKIVYQTTLNHIIQGNLFDGRGKSSSLLANSTSADQLNGKKHIFGLSLDTSGDLQTNRLKLSGTPGHTEQIHEIKFEDFTVTENNTSFSSESCIHDPCGSISEDGKDKLKQDIQRRLTSIYNSVAVVKTIERAKEVVLKLTNEYRGFIHACDTEVSSINVKQETPIDHGEVICFSIYSGSQANFGDGKSCIWVDVLDGGTELLHAFIPFFEDTTIRKVWHNFSFDKHVLENYGFSVLGFHADTMHMARLWDTSRSESGYSLESLTCSPQLTSCKKEKCSSGSKFKERFGKMSMKSIFGQTKMNANGSKGKTVFVSPVHVLQREKPIEWICYSAFDAISTLQLYESLENHLQNMPWKVDGKFKSGKSMFDFYVKYYQPFGDLLTKIEAEGMLVDREFLSEAEKIARHEQAAAVDRFRNWASKYCPDAKFMNVSSDHQLRQLFFGGIPNRKNPEENLPFTRSFSINNVDNIIDEGKRTPLKKRKINLHRVFRSIVPIGVFTPAGWPSVSVDALQSLAGNLLTGCNPMESDSCNLSCNGTDNKGASTNGEDMNTFLSKEEGINACHAIASLCEVCAIDSLISNFILPLQGKNYAGKKGRIHCSLNINTETGRLSARRPNLQNQPSLDKDRYKIRKAFTAAPGNSLIVADYGQLELRILAHLADCRSMLNAFRAGGDFHSRTAMNMYPYIREAVETNQVLLEWSPQSGHERPPVPLLKDMFAAERRKAKMLNFSIVYGKTVLGLASDWKVSKKEAQETVNLWYKDKKEVRIWQNARKEDAEKDGNVQTLLGRSRRFPSMSLAKPSQRAHMERAAINTAVQGSAADVAMCAMLAIAKNKMLQELGWKLIMQIHDEVILEGPTESAEVAKGIVIHCMSMPFDGKNVLKVDLAVDAKAAPNWYAAK